MRCPQNTDDLGSNPRRCTTVYLVPVVQTVDTVSSNLASCAFESRLGYHPIHDSFALLVERQTHLS